MASAWDTWKPGDPLPSEPDPGQGDLIGHTMYMVAHPEGGGSSTTPSSTSAPGLSTGTPTPGGAAGSTGAAPGLSGGTAAPTYNPLQNLQPREAYGPYLAGDLAARTVGIDAKTRVDPYTSQRYVMGNDGTWRESGFVSRDQMQTLRDQGAMPPVGAEVQAQTRAGPQLGANPQLRGGAGTAGMAGGLLPGDVPQLPNLAQFNIPGLGFSANDYRPGLSNIDLTSVRLPTQVATRPYGFDFGGIPAGTGGRSTGPGQVQVDMPRYQVPNGYMGGPSGFSATGPNGPYFQPMALPFNVASPTFNDLTRSAPAMIGPNQPGAGGTLPPPSPLGQGVYGPPETQATRASAAAYAQQQGGTNPTPQARPGEMPGIAVNGTTLSPAVVSAVMQAWANSPEAIPQALALAARESGGNPAIDNSKTGPGGTPLNNQYQSPTLPSGAPNPYYNSIDYGLFGINDQNFPGLGLTQETARDPLRNAQAAYQLFQNSKGFGPWTGGGTIPLPAPADLSKVSLAQLANTPQFYKPTGTPAASSGFTTGGSQDLYPVQGPGTLQPAGMTGRGGAGALLLNGPQTAEIRGGGIGFGFNPETILKDYGRAGAVPQDPAARAFAALALMDKNTQLQQAGMKTPLDAFIAMNTPSASNYGAPQGGQVPGAQTAQAAQQATQAAVDQAEAERRREEDAMYGGDGRNFGFAQGGTIESLGRPHMEHRYAQGGRVVAGPGRAVAPIKTTEEGGMPLMQPPAQTINLQQPQTQQKPPTTFAKGGTVVAPIRTSEEQGGIVPGAGAVQQQAPMQQPMAQPSADAASASNSEANLSPIQSGDTTSVQPNYQLGSVNPQTGSATNAMTASPEAMTAGGANTTPGADTGIAPIGGAQAQTSTGANPDLYKPFNDALSYLAGVNRIRNNQSVWRLGQLGAPTAIGTLLPGQTPQNLPPGVFYDPTPLINSRVGDIKSLQDQIAAYGNPGTVEQISGEMTPVQNLLNTFGDINTTRRNILGYGDIGDPNDISNKIVLAKEDIRPYEAVQDVALSLKKLGTTLPFDEANNRIYATKQGISDLNGIIAAGPQLDPQQRGYYNQFTGEVYPIGAAGLQQWQSAMSGLMNSYTNTLAAQQLDLQNATEAQRLQGELARLDPTGMALPVYAQKQAALDALNRQYQDALNVGHLKTSLQGLLSSVGSNTEAGLNAQMSGLQDRLASARSLGKANTQLGNLLALGVPGAGMLPGFAKGGNWIAGATSNAHGQFRAKAKAAGMSTRAYASKMQDAPGKTGKQARLAKTLMGFAGGGQVSAVPPDIPDWLLPLFHPSHPFDFGPSNTGQALTFAGGGTMVTPEPIVGVGMMTGKPRFMVGEPQRPGGPPMQERLTITPMNKPSLPMGVMRRAA